jgi:hypothetical protein
LSSWYWNRWAQQLESSVAFKKILYDTLLKKELQKTSLSFIISCQYFFTLSIGSDFHFHTTVSKLLLHYVNKRWEDQHSIRRFFWLP